MCGLRRLAQRPPGEQLLRGPRQGQLRLQHVEQMGPNSAHETVDLASLFEPGYLSLEKMTERTLSLARR